MTRSWSEVFSILPRIRIRSRVVAAIEARRRRRLESHGSFFPSPSGERQRGPRTPFEDVVARAARPTTPRPTSVDHHPRSSPTRISPSQKRGCGQSKSITLEVLSANFHLPINDVARKVRPRKTDGPCGPRFLPPRVKKETLPGCPPPRLLTQPTRTPPIPAPIPAARSVRHRPQAAMPRARHHQVAVPQGARASPPPNPRRPVPPAHPPPPSPPRRPASSSSSTATSLLASILRLTVFDLFLPLLPLANR